MPPFSLSMSALATELCILPVSSSTLLFLASYPPQTQMSVLRVVIHVRRMQSAQILREALCVSVYLDTEMLSLHASVSSFSLLVVLSIFGKH